MREVLVAVFETVARADTAVRALEAANIPSSAIRRYHKDDPSIPHASFTGQQSYTGAEANRQSGVHYDETQDNTYRAGGGGLWSWFMGEQGTTSDWRDPTYDESHNQMYSRSIESGNVVVAVYVEETDADRVMRLLADQNPTMLEDTGAEAGIGTSATQRMASEGQRMGRSHEEGDEKIRLAEEQVEIGKRRVEHPVQVRRYVVERPVEKTIPLRDERVEIERRPAQGAADAGAFQERTVEVRESHEEPTVSKTARVNEEVVVRRESTERTAKVQDTARKEEVEVDRKDQKNQNTRRQ